MCHIFVASWIFNKNSQLFALWMFELSPSQTLNLKKGVFSFLEKKQNVDAYVLFSGFWVHWKFMGTLKILDESEKLKINGIKKKKNNRQKWFQYLFLTVLSNSEILLKKMIPKSKYSLMLRKKKKELTWRILNICGALRSSNKKN